MEPPESLSTTKIIKSLPDHSGKYLKDDQETIYMDTAHGGRTK